MGNEKPILITHEGMLLDLTPENQGKEGAIPVYPDAEEALQVFRHSCSHVLAQAVWELFPGVQYGIGPAVADGFYYDFLTPTPFTPEDLQSISKRMNEIVKKNHPIQRLVWTKNQALEYFSRNGQELKVELIQEKVEGDEVTVYKQGDFVDLCRGPHLPYTRYLKHFRLLSVAASYWKGDESSHSLQRIYGTVFPQAEQLETHLRMLKEAQERDHRKLGKELDLFSIQNDIGPGLILWHPNGAVIRHEIETFWKSEHFRREYELIFSPHVARLDLWKTSGHLDFYKENMFSAVELDSVPYQLKPMNCPFHIVIYKSRNRSYRELPLRWAELGTVYRFERSGVLHGLMRVRGFTQDDAHIICTHEQIEEEILRVLDFSLDLLRTFGFNEFRTELSVRDPEKTGKYAGSDEMWKTAEASLLKALTARNLPYERMEGEAVFYGPKIDIKIKDALGRTWQCTTIQFDFNLPERFGMKYIGRNGEAQTPYMVHRALLGSLERFFGILIEHYAGFFPVWLAPVQAIVLPVSENHLDYAQQVCRQLKASGIRAEVEGRNEAIGRKIRDAELRKIPYLLIVGDAEEKSRDVSLRIHRKGDQGKRDLARFIENVKKIVEEKNQTYEA